MLANAIANLTNVLQMKCEYEAWVTNLHIHIAVFLIVLYLPASVQSAYFPLNLYSLSTFVLHSTEMSIQMIAELYKRLTIHNYKC